MRIRRFGAALVFGLAAACGGDGPSGPSGPDGNTLANGSFSARVDGASFNAVAATIVASSAGQAGTILAIGAGTSAGNSLGFAWIDSGTGTYAINQAVAANATYTEAGRSWSAQFGNQGSGSIVVTTRTATRVAGTFSFVMVPVGGGASGNKTITQGAFDLTF